MPLYEYECDNCGNRFECFRSIHDEPLKQCPKCSSNTVCKLFSPTGVIFKGSGWYINDSRKLSSTETKATSTSASSSKSSTETKPSTETSPSSETKTETKTESKKESKKESSDSK